MRLADAVGADEDRVDAFVEEAESEELFDALRSIFFGHAQSKSAMRFEGADARVPESSLEAAALALGLLDVRAARRARACGRCRRSAREQTEEAELSESCAQFVRWHGRVMASFSVWSWS